MGDRSHVHTQQPGDQQGDVGEERDQREGNKHRNQPGTHILDHLVERGLCRGGQHEQGLAVGRRHQSDHQVQDDHDSQVNFRDAHLLDQRLEDGNHQQNGGRGVQNHAQEEQDQVDQQQHHQLVVSDGEDAVEHQFAQMLELEHPAEQRRGGDDGQGGDNAGDGLADALANVGKRHFTVENADGEEAVGNGDAGRLGGGERAAGDAAQNNGDHQQGPEALAEPVQDFLKRTLGVDFVFAPFGLDEHKDAQHDGDYDTRSDTRHEQGSHRHAGGCAVNDHGDGRRDNGTHGGGGRCDAEDQVVLIALVAHGLDFHRAQAAHVRQGGAGHAGKDKGRQDVHVGETAGEVTQDGAAETEDAVRDAALIHDDARHHEHGNGQKDEVVQASVHLGHHSHIVYAAVDEDIGQAAAQQAEVDRRAEHQESNKYNQKDNKC